MRLPSRNRNALLMAALAIATFTAAPAAAGDDDLADIGREVQNGTPKQSRACATGSPRPRLPRRTAASRTAPNAWPSWRATPVSSKPR
jgi:hypothetical protein